MNIKQADQQHIIGTYNRQDVIIASGQSATCYDETGKGYIDFGSGIGVNALGYCDEEWSKAVCVQATKLQHTSNLYYTQPCVELAEMLTAKSGYQKVLFCNSGAEANECAIKIARKYSFDQYKTADRHKILTLTNSFHGRTITTLSATGQDAFHHYFFPFTDGFDYADANDFAMVKMMLSSGGYCGVMFEFVQGEGGVIPLEHGFIDQLVTLCEELDILTIADEVQTGIGRTGTFLAREQYHVLPNITTVAKGLGGGLPIGGCLTDEKTCNVLSFSDHGTTYGGNPIACAGAIVVLNRISDTEFLQEVTRKSAFIRSELSSCPEVLSVDGLGMMLGIALKSKKASDVLTTCLEQGLLVLTAKDKIRLLPPLTITQKELVTGLSILKSALQ